MGSRQRQPVYRISCHCQASKVLAGLSRLTSYVRSPLTSRHNGRLDFRRTSTPPFKNQSKVKQRQRVQALAWKAVATYVTRIVKGRQGDRYYQARSNFGLTHCEPQLLVTCLPFLSSICTTCPILSDLHRRRRERETLPGGHLAELSVLHVYSGVEYTVSMSSVTVTATLNVAAENPASCDPLTQAFAYDKSSP